ncbi:MAG: hypothetical protein GFH27_549303n187 [Chloroflexi bacterium AL-W]|nr:hypothetical protein [Chloroflexi bacterium AL-N1]NOK68072.1 hypothetical protein [Chloroflexi bacterium AL-N10]NOK73412.1 hypothetical protein [Chloroflexi bacterium AL-N5]NOK83326.1 hypothetical protein [Chloroflexi bacterium AL-W]NOK87743.1 hypothetical protein [Chloroflexi bacterium AL-N15]
MKKKLRIAIVDESPEFLDLIMRLLGKEDYHLKPLTQHQGAYEQIKDIEPDIIICDVSLEGEAAHLTLMDMLYLDPQTRTIPLIVCAASTQNMQQISPSLSAKGIELVEKPYTVEELVDVIQKCYPD